MHSLVCYDEGLKVVEMSPIITLFSNNLRSLVSQEAPPIKTLPDDSLEERMLMTRLFKSRNSISFFAECNKTGLFLMSYIRHTPKFIFLSILYWRIATD